MSTASEIREGRKEFHERIMREGRTTAVAEAFKSITKRHPDWSRADHLAYIMDQFPPLTAGSSAEFSTNKLPASTSHEADLTWAYSNLGRDPRPEDAPSGPAWAMYLWGERSPKELVAAYSKVVTVKKNVSREKSKKIADDKRRQFTLIRLLVQDIRDARRKRKSRGRPEPEIAEEPLVDEIPEPVDAGDPNVAAMLSGK